MQKQTALMIDIWHTHVWSKPSLILVHSFGRNGHGNPIRMTFECAGWRANMRYRAHTQHWHWDQLSHASTLSTPSHAWRDTTAVREAISSGCTCLHTVFTQIWSCWYRISISLYYSSTVSYPGREKAMKLEEFFSCCVSCCKCLPYFFFVASGEE